MIALKLGEAAEAARGRLLDADPATPVAGFSIDSRTVAPGEVFVALPGERAHGADFAATAVAKGAAAVLLRSSPARGGLPRIEVDDPLDGLAAMAAVVRSRSAANVVGVTGSNGKTTTKDLLAAALSTTLDTVASRGSHNNELGLPLTIGRLEPGTQALVVELGARGPGHIAKLCELALPDVGIVLNVLEAHLGMFGSREAIASAKGELVEALSSDGTAILNADDPAVAAMATRTRARVLTFGTCPDAGVRAERIRLDPAGRAQVLVRVGDWRDEVLLPRAGTHLVSDALAALAAASVLGVPPDRAAEGLAGAALSPMRMETAERPDGVLVINDAYNANPSSMAAALEVLESVRRPAGRTVAVLGEMAELGPAAPGEHDRLGRLAASLGVDRIVGVGPMGALLVAGARSQGSRGAIAVDDPASAVALLDDLVPGDVVLVKASRAIALERVVEGLLADCRKVAGTS